jgi:hypothetical protein
MERQTADAFAEHVDDRIDRRVTTGAKDKGDIGGLRVHNQRVVVECKDVATMSIGTWVAEAEAERINDKALAGFVVHKRRGKGNPLDQYVTMTLRDVIALITGTRPEDETTPEES